MCSKILKILQILLVAAAAVQIMACGARLSTSTLFSPSPPTTSSSKIPSGPMLAAWWDAERNGLRIVYGVPGAAYQGAPTYADASYSGATTCMRGKVALFTSPSGAVDEVILPQGKPVVIAQSAVPKANITFSPSCTTALIDSPGRSQAVLVQNLLSTATTTSVTLPAGWTSAIVADSGKILTADSEPDGSASVELDSGGTGSGQLIVSLSHYGGMAFLPGVDSALMADAGASTVIEASHLANGPGVAVIAAEKDGVSGPIAVNVSSDGHWAAIANGKGSNILRLDVTGQSAPSQLNCNCSPTELEALAGNFAFRLNEPGSGTVWEFDGDAPTPRFVFIPAEQSAIVAQGARR
jgi:hypothetical protein